MVIYPLKSLFFSLTCPNSIKLRYRCKSYRYSIATLAKHLGHTMDNTAYRHTVFGDDNFNCGNETNFHGNTFNLNNIIADENPEIMKWLSPLDPRRRHHDVRTDRIDGVGNWLLETSEFRQWRGGGGGADKAVLFCSGDPGVGKTYLR